MNEDAKTLDVITIGRSSVDLYGAQVGGRLEDMRAFSKYIGGSPTNIAAGTARLGLKSGLITRVGDEHMGRFIREQLDSEGVDTRGVITDPERLTALVLLGIRDHEQFPLIFYRENCADMALCEDDIDAAFIAEARCVTATGTHLSHPRTEAAVLKALHLAREAGARTALDIDYRPNLWGLAGHDAGESRFIASDAVTARLQATLHLFDLIVGTEEEFHIAGGTTDTLAALRAVRAVSTATLVCKRGPMGAVAFSGDIPDALDDGISGPGFPIEVFNVLGAGDGFMSGLLRGWLKGEAWEAALTYANACGALAVSRHGCAPAYPSWEELSFFLERGVRTPALRHDAELEQVHWSTNRNGDWPAMRVFAFDHRKQLEDLAAEAGAEVSRIPHFKVLCLAAARRVQDGRAGYGILCDGRLGEPALHAAAGTGLWVGRPVEEPGSRPLALEIGPDFGSDLAEWPAGQVVKVLCFYHPGDAPEMKTQQEETIMRLARAARANGLEFLLEVIPSKVGPVDETTTAGIVQRFYDLGVYPDWWKLEPSADVRSWKRTCETVARNDPHVRGVVVLGLDAPMEDLEASFAIAAGFDLVKGFAVGRTIFAGPARRWFAGEIDDATAVCDMADTFARLCAIWDSARAIGGHLAGDQAGKQGLAI
ncbi:5-dehydro-2-deoxygluconokinase [Stappia sp. ES.058]|uniref:bifunctional 5-dehydro-2-deoxygluconokinase/5-dehydro-2- deoxyphosphogluconate aldolase n=1 Tax=Stappia sp. ES.058 TaxID=1881061 RepID=UPI0015617BC7|nr:5-dehydro-2-deoxygluconokinase [Stappia sp. ES.058]